jgi:hypothetical protein
MKAVTFTNWTNEDFTHAWDSVPYTFKKGKSMMVPDWQAEHFAKHLTDREMNKDGVATDHSSRQSYVDKCYTNDDEIEADDEAALEVAIMNEKKKFCSECDSKGVSHKKDCPTRKQVEEEFEGFSQ